MLWTRKAQSYTSRRVTISLFHANRGRFLRGTKPCAMSSVAKHSSITPHPDSGQSLPESTCLSEQTFESSCCY